MSYAALAYTLAFVGLAMALSYWQRVGLERDMLIATVRSAVQLVAVGYVLKLVFQAHDVLWVILMVCLMMGVASQNAAQRGQAVPGVFWRILAAIALTECVTQGLLLGFRVVPATPRYIIPISGMIIGNAMVASGLLLNRLQSDVAARASEIVLRLSLGAAPRQAVWPVLRSAVRSSMIPTVDNTKTMGLVQLPGMMTGIIIAGANPIQAVRYQLLIVFALMASAALVSITLGFLSYPGYFNRYQQLQGAQGAG